MEAADELMYERGVAETTLNDVRAASGTSKSQIYQHFADRDALIRAVIAHRAKVLLDQQNHRLQRLDSLRGLELWRNALVERNAVRNGAYGCPLAPWLPSCLTWTRERAWTSSAPSPRGTQCCGTGWNECVHVES